MTTTTGPAVEVPDHPAKWHRRALALGAAEVLAEARRLDRGIKVLDPFAGVGGIHDLRDAGGPGAHPVITVGLELEPEWAAAHPGTIAGDVLAMPAEWLAAFDVLFSSPCYGNRMADDHNARDDSERNTYRHKLRRPLSPGSAAGMQWGPVYRRFHLDAMRALLAVLRLDGLLLWNVKNHYRAPRTGAPTVEQLVAEWHLRTWLELGARLVAVHNIPATGNRQGANGTLRTEAEFLFVLRAPTTSALL